MTTAHRVWLAGSKFGDAGMITGEIPEGTRLILKRESENPHDPNAVSVWISVGELQNAGVTFSATDAILAAGLFRLGFLPASRGPNWAALVSVVLESGGEVVAKFRRHAKRQLRITLDSAALPEVIA